MAGRFTGLQYDPCAIEQKTRQSEAPLGHMMDVTKFVHPNRFQNGPTVPKLPQRSIVDVESCLMGLDRVQTRCDGGLYPSCGENGCLLRADSGIPPNDTPYIFERGTYGDRKSVVSSNIPPVPRPAPLPRPAAVSSGFYRNY